MRKKQKLVFENCDGNLHVTISKKKQARKPFNLFSDNPNRPFKKTIQSQVGEVENIKIKTLTEIRAERNAKLHKIEDEKEESEVSSTSKEEEPFREIMEINELQQNVESTCSSSNPLLRKLRIRRKLPLSDNITSSNPNTTNRNVDLLVGTNYTTDNEHDSMGKKNTVSSNEEKMLDDILLLEEDEDDYDITLKAEEDLLKDIDDD